uniref:Uncharacterized protein n=1 Tax=Anguilla anguilla TaxID=7936 RepID=A0A0E9WJR5_ANGAN
MNKIFVHCTAFTLASVNTYQRAAHNKKPFHFKYAIKTGYTSRQQATELHNVIRMDSTVCEKHTYFCFRALSLGVPSLTKQ